MRDTIRIALIFILILALLALLSTVLMKFVGPRPQPEDDAAEAEETVYNEFNEKGAAVITLDGDHASLSGLGARIDGSVVTVVYPGTYRIEGVLTDGQLVVDLGDYSGAVYLLFSGASITNSRGPAVHVVQADRTVVHLAADTSNTLCDGKSYTVETAGELHPGAALYSADDLVIEGEGRLTLLGSSADGLRVKDSLTVTGGALNISSVDDGIQVNDSLTVTGGDILIGCNGDGVAVSLGNMTVSGGRFWINSLGDAVAVAGDLTVTDGYLNAATYIGSSMYAAIAMNDLSAKGLKAGSIVITGGSLDLDCADDAIHSMGDVTVTGGTLDLSSGDDAIHAEGLLEVRNIGANILYCYEALEGREIRLGSDYLNITAQYCAVDAGEGGFTLEDGVLNLTAPRAVGSEGPVSVGGMIKAVCDGTRSPLTFLTAEITGGLQLVCAGSGVQTVLEGGELPRSLLFVLPSTVPAGTAVTLYDGAGTALTEHVTAADGGMFLYAGSLMTPGQTFTLTAGDESYTAAVTEGCTVTPESALTAQSASGEPSGGPSRG